MMTLSSRVAATAIASLFLMGSAFARNPRAGRCGSGARRPKSRGSAASLECSKEADAKGLHGKERKKFMIPNASTTRRPALPPSSDLVLT